MSTSVRFWAWLAAAWAVVFAAPHFFWATGAEAGLRTALSDEFVNNAGFGFQLLNLGIGVFSMCGATVALATLREWPARWRRLTRRVLLALVWFGAVALILRCLDIYVEFGLGLTEVRKVPDEYRDNYLYLARWFLFFWMPWFALGAVCWTRLARVLTRNRVPA